MSDLRDDVSALLLDGFTEQSTGRRIGLLPAVEEHCLGLRSGAAGRYSKGPGSRPPLGMGPLNLLVSVHRDGTQLYREATEQVFGRPRRAYLFEALAQFPDLVDTGRVWIETRQEVEEACARWIRQARLLLDEVRPDAVVRALSCPHCSTAPSSLRLRASDEYSVGVLYCSESTCVDPTGNQWQWNASILGDFMGEVFAEKMAS